MKGSQASPEVLLSRYIRQSLFPDTPYRFNSGGEPSEIPNLTIRQWKDELSKSIIGAIGDIDRYKLPAAKGHTSMMRFLTGVNDVDRQQVREDILGTTPRHFKAFGEALEPFADSNFIKVLASENVLKKAMPEGMEGLELLKVL